MGGGVGAGGAFLVVGCLLTVTLFSPFGLRVECSFSCILASTANCSCTVTLFSLVLLLVGLSTSWLTSESFERQMLVLRPPQKHPLFGGVVKRRFDHFFPKLYALDPLLDLGKVKITITLLWLSISIPIPI